MTQKKMLTNIILPTVELFFSLEKQPKLLLMAVANVEASVLNSVLAGISGIINPMHSVFSWVNMVCNNWPI